MGSVTQTHKGVDRKVAIPLVYALLQSKQEDAYDKVLEVSIAAVERAGVRMNQPETLMTDLEQAIINAAKSNFAEEVIRLCLFHLCQSAYRRIQGAGLQQRYGDPQDVSIRHAARSMMALSFVPVQDVPRVFDMFYNDVPDDFIEIANYFEVNYIRGIRARGRRRAVTV